jgi:hypothetical protein
MTLLQNDPITQLAFSVYENKGVFTVLLGSGLSRSAEVPTGWEITLDLVRRVAAAQGVPEQSDWAKWYREKTGQEPNYSVLLEEIASSPDERRAILHRYIEPDEQDRVEGRKTPTKAHHAIANLVRSGYLRVIVTTNFDRLMENALREQGIEPTVVASADALVGAEPLTHSRCYVLKLHGDYKDARILNTDRELSAYPDSYNRLLDRIFDEHGLIVCGWSGEWDHALRAAFIRAPSRRYPVYWVARGTLGSGAQGMVTHRDARIVPISGADEFFQTLQQRVETLEQSQRQNPLSVELLVNSAKRYLAKPEHRIQLDELFSQETDRLLDQLEGDTFSAQGQWSQETFRARVRLYESLTEPLARMAGVLGRWGDDKEFAVVLDVLRSLFHHAGKIGSGLTHWLNLRGYPAVLVFTAYGIGLTKAARWDTLLKLFSSPLASEHREPKRIVSVLFLWSWAGGEQQLWQQIEGLDRRKTPLSDHLLEVMTHWRKSFTGSDANFELLFDRFEMMGSLAAFHENDEAQLEKAVEASAIRNDVLAWMPVGRAGWHSAGARTLLQELEDDSRITELLKAGFAKGSRRFLQLFSENFKLYARRMGW